MTRILLQLLDPYRRIYRDFRALVEDLRPGQMLAIAAVLLFVFSVFFDPIMDFVDSIRPRKSPTPRIAPYIGEWSSLIWWLASLLIIVGAYLEIRASRRRLSELSITLSNERDRYSTTRGRSSRLQAREEVVAKQGVIPDVPQGLADAAMADDVVLVMGAGCSAQASLPTSVPFLLNVLDDVSSGIDRETLEILRDAIADGDKAAVETLLATVGRERLVDATKRILALPDSLMVPNLFRILCDRPWPAIIGLTWDELDLRTFGRRDYTIIRAMDSPRMAEALRSSQPILIKPIGDVLQPDTIALTWQDYRQVLERWPDLVRGLATLFSTRTLFFIGAGLDTVEEFLNGLPPRSVSNRTHYALVPADRANAVWQHGIGKRFNIQLIEMVPSAGYPELPLFIQKLYQQAPRSRRSKISNSGAPRALELKSIRLKNIGLFENIELKFSDRWNVLLGVNGGGKSTVLKAIGLALCGNDPRAEEAAQRLLRNGTSSGLIEIELGQDKITVELSRERDRVRIGAPPVTPVEAGTMLALGFPALRGVIGTRPTGYAPLPHLDPSTEDLLPLVIAPYDKRLDRFMQWALNIKLAGDRDPEGPDHALLLTLESLISSLIPPRPLSLVARRVESGRFELLLDTGDTVVPFELISQGMSSIFNWVGVLLQRLYDVFPPTPDHPGESAAKPALVLIDEIDAHLHPEWQRRLVDLVRKHFPAVQVIATCHSPLIVGALERNEILIIRDRQNFMLSEDPKGMNAEDILTGSGFGMSSTRAESGQQEIAQYLELRTKSDRTPDQEEEYAVLQRRFGELRYGTSAKEERVRKIVYEALQSERSEPQEIGPELRLLVERELGAAAISLPHNLDASATANTTREAT